MNTKFFQIMFVGLGMTLMTACGSPNSNRTVTPVSGEGKSAAGQCDAETDKTTKAQNLDRVFDEILNVKNRFSGAAADLKDIINAAEVEQGYQGLPQVCDKAEMLVVSCDGKVALIEAGNVENPDVHDLDALNAVYVKKAIFCNQVSLKANQVLYVVADEIEFKNTSIALAEGAALSLSTSQITHTQELQSVHQGLTSSLSIHAKELN